MKAEVIYGDGLKAAVAHFVQIARGRHLEDVGAEQRGSARERALLASRLLAPSGRYLTHILTMKTRPEKVDVESYESFAKSTLLWSNDFSFYQAKLELHHPEKPSAEAALQYLKQTASKASFRPFANKRTNVVHLSLDAASFLLQEDRYNDGAFIMDFLRKNYTAELGITEATAGGTVRKHDDRLPPVFDELSNLELLASLDPQRA